MTSHFKTLREAKKEFKNRTSEDFGNRTISLGIYSRRKDTPRLKKPFFVGSYFQWLNL